MKSRLLHIVPKNRNKSLCGLNKQDIIFTDTGLGCNCINCIEQAEREML